jgi:hypothetical protein
MPDFLYEMPARDLARLCILVTVGATWFGILFVKPLLRLLVGGEANVNGAIGYVTSVFSLFYGLLVGLLAVAAYQNLEDVRHSAFREAAGLATLYDGVDSYPDALRVEFQSLLRDYVLFSIHKDWPAHRAGEMLNGGGNRVDVMRQRLATFAPEGAAQEIVHREVFGLFHDFSVARQERLSGVLTRIPNVLWYAVGAGAAVNIVLLVMLRIRPLPHLVLGGLASFFLGVMLFLVISLDDPLRGVSGLDPEALELLWESRMTFDEPQTFGPPAGG